MTLFWIITGIFAFGWLMALSLARAGRDDFPAPPRTRDHYEEAA